MKRQNRKYKLRLFEVKIMQKVRKIVIILIIGILLVLCNYNISLATDLDNNLIANEFSNENESKIESSELIFPDIEVKNNEEIVFGSLTIEEIIGGATILQCLIGIILVISLYSRSRMDGIEKWYYDDKNEEIEEDFADKLNDNEEPKAIKELKKEEASKEPKAMQEFEDKKKIEEIKRKRELEQEEENNIPETVEEKENTSSLNYKHQKALDDFYNYAEEIKKENKPKRGKGKHSM